MLSQRVANIVFVVLVLAACGWFAWQAEGFVTSGLLASSGLPSKFFPQLTLGLMALCAAIVGLSYAIRGSAGGDEGETVFGDAGEARRGLLMLAVAIASYVVWRQFGYVAMAALAGPLSLLAMGERRLPIYLVVLAITGAVTVVFTVALGIRLV